MGSQKDIAFGGRDTKAWSEYEDFRPTYPRSFFNKIYEYHAKDHRAHWDRAIDVGAGAGIVSGPLADRFKKVVVADPNEEYISIARKRLVDGLGLPESSFEFVQEGAEKSVLPPESVDLVSACICIHWSDTVAALKEFHRILRPGGTVFIAFYNRPQIIDNPPAREAWHRLFYIKNANPSPVLERALRVADAGLTTLEFAEDSWTDVRREFINTGGSLDAFDLSGIPRSESRVGPNDEVVWLEDDPDWAGEKTYEWFKRFERTFEPAIPIEKLREHFDAFEKALGDKRDGIKIQTPVALLFARKK